MRLARRAFLTGAVLLIVTAVLHTIGNLDDGSGDPTFAPVKAAMEGHRLPMGLGMTPSIQDIYRDLVFTMSILLVALGGVDLVAAWGLDDGARLKRLAWVNLAAVVALVALCYRYRIPPPLISFVVVTVPFLLAAVAPIERTSPRG